MYIVVNGDLHGRYSMSIAFYAYRNYSNYKVSAAG